MCMITLLSPLKLMKKEIDDKYFSNSYYFNEDGSGFSYLADKGTDKQRLRIVKGIFGLTKFLNKFHKFRNENPDSYFMVHQRNATRGEISYKNCHPFHAGKVAIAHNGTLFKLNAKKDIELSDSMKLAELVKKLPPNWYEKDVYYEMLQDFIGTGNRVSFMLPDGNIFYIGSGWIKYEDGIIFSNDYFRRVIPKTTTNTTTNYAANNKNNNDFQSNCVICGKRDVFVRENDKNYCENCYITMKNKQANDNKLLPFKNSEVDETTGLRFCPECKINRLITGAEREKNMCGPCYLKVFDTLIN